MLVAYHLLLFTDFVADPELQYTVGFSCAGVILANVLANVTVLVADKVRPACLKCRYASIRRQKRQEASRIEEEGPSELITPAKKKIPQAR